MEQRYRSQLAVLREQFISHSGTDDVKMGNWDPKSHFHFMVLYKKYVHKGKQEDLVERASAEMPEKPLQEIEVCTDVFEFLLPTKRLKRITYNLSVANICTR